MDSDTKRHEVLRARREGNRAHPALYFPKSELILPGMQRTELCRTRRCSGIRAAWRLKVGIWSFVGIWILGFGVLLNAQTTNVAPIYETRTVHDPNGIGKFYMGREIAH